jgi:hypothetical protein
MSEAMRSIASHYVRLKDRVALERLRDHRNKLLQDYRIHMAQGFRVETLETSLQGDLEALDEALSSLPQQDVN